MRPFLTDDALAARLRSIESKLRDRHLPELANQLADIAWILESEEAVA